MSDLRQEAELTTPQDALPGSKFCKISFLISSYAIFVRDSSDANSVQENQQLKTLLHKNAQLFHNETSNWEDRNAVMNMKDIAQELFTEEELQWNHQEYP